ncbi:hypothetical protein [Streptomyces sp. NPDC003247]|uniref:hypothetical protein n=1 Tax=Streptomyces sp. NPDC003247 TaxID=3364677 RepID=UPI0036CA976E
MTSMTDTTGHPDVEEISDLTEGLLPPSRSADVRRHLDACVLCADVHASLEEIRGLLGTLPGAPHMPDDVAHRIDAALAAEALLDATTPDATVTGRTSSADQAASTDRAVASTDRAPLTESAPGPEPDPAAHVSRETSAAASRPAGHARDSATGPGRKARTKRGRRKVAALGTVLAVAALGLGSVLVSSLIEDDGSGNPAGPSSTAADTFAASSLEQHVTDLLAEATGPRNPDEMGAQTEPEVKGPTLLQQPTVPPCVQKGIGRSEAALATEPGTYRGKDALLVVLPTSDSTKVTAYLMDAACVEQRSAGPAEVFLQGTYTRR